MKAMKNIRDKSLCKTLSNEKEKMNGNQGLEAFASLCGVSSKVRTTSESMKWNKSPNIVVADVTSAISSTVSKSTLSGSIVLSWPVTSDNLSASSIHCFNAALNSESVLIHTSLGVGCSSIFVSSSKSSSLSLAMVVTFPVSSSKCSRA